MQDLPHALNATTPTPIMMARNWFALAVCMNGMKMKPMMKN